MHYSQLLVYVDMSNIGSLEGWFVLTLFYGNIKLPIQCLPGGVIGLAQHGSTMAPQLPSPGPGLPHQSLQCFKLLIYGDVLKPSGSLETEHCWVDTSADICEITVSYFEDAKAEGLKNCLSAQCQENFTKQQGVFGLP